jgi:hypothetical protein
MSDEPINEEVKPQPEAVLPLKTTTPEPVAEPTPISSEAPSEAKAEPEQAISPEPSEAPKVAETQTAQTPVSEPLNSTSEPLSSSAESSGGTKSEQVETKVETTPTEIETPEVKPEPAKEEVRQTETRISEPIIITKSKTSQKDLWQKFLAKIQIGKRKKLEKIMTLFAKRTKITNDEVEKYLHVSDATAERYLNILEKENKIKQSGKTGKSVFYSKI